MQERTTDPVSNKVESEGWHSRFFFDCHMSAVTQPHSHTSYTYTHTQRKIKHPSSFVVCFCPWFPTLPHSDWIGLLAIVPLSGLCWCFPWNSRSKDGSLAGFQHMPGKKLYSLFWGVSLKPSNKIHLTCHMADILLLAHLRPLSFYCYVTQVTRASGMGMCPCL